MTSLRFAFCFPMATGHINPSLPIAKALTDLGHEVHYMSRKEMEPLILGTGASFTDVASQQTELYEGRETDIMGCFRTVAQEMGCADGAMMVSMLKTAPRHLELQMPGTIRWLRKIQPQLVLFCPFMNGEALFAAKSLQIPAVGLWTFAGPGSLVGIVNMFLMQSGGLEAAEVLRQVESFEPMLESIRRFKENYGFDLDFRGFLEPKGFLFTFCDTRYNLVTTGEELQDPLPSELAERYQDAKFITVGPLLQASAANSESDVLTEIREAHEAGRKVILVSMGTILTSNTEDVGWHSVPRDGSEVPRGLTGKQLCHSAWSAAFDAFGHWGDVASGEASGEVPLLVVAVGSQEDALEDLQVPKNARCYPYLPQVEILKAKVDLFLTHGGQNSFMESLMAGTPVVVCPGFADQIANAMRAETSGVGLQIPRPVPPHGEELSAMARYRAAVAAALQRVLTEPQFGEMAQQIGTKLRQEGGVPRAVELLMETAREARPTLLGNLRRETDVAKEVQEKAAEAAHA